VMGFMVQSFAVIDVAFYKIFPSGGKSE